METKNKIYIAVGVALIILATLWICISRSTPTNNDVDRTIQSIETTNTAIGHEIETSTNAVDRATEASTVASDAISDSQRANTAIAEGITSSQNLINECIGINEQTQLLLETVERTNQERATSPKT